MSSEDIVRGTPEDGYGYGNWHGGSTKARLGASDFDYRHIVRGTSEDGYGYGNWHGGSTKAGLGASNDYYRPWLSSESIARGTPNYGLGDWHGGSTKVGLDASDYDFPSHDYDFPSTPTAISQISYGITGRSGIFRRSDSIATTLADQNMSAEAFAAAVNRGEIFHEGGRQVAASEAREAYALLQNGGPIYVGVSPTTDRHSPRGSVDRRSDGERKDWLQLLGEVMTITTPIITLLLAIDQQKKAFRWQEKQYEKQRADSREDAQMAREHAFAMASHQAGLSAANRPSPVQVTTSGAGI